MEAEILTSTPEMNLLNLAQVFDMGTLAADVSTPPKGSRNVPMCLRDLQKYLVHGSLIEADTLTTPLPHAFGQLSPVLGDSTLPTGVSTPPKCPRDVPMCFGNLQKVFGAWDLKRS